jgi:hypothetical protein
MDARASAEAVKAARLVYRDAYGPDVVGTFALALDKFAATKERAAVEKVLEIVAADIATFQAESKQARSRPKRETAMAFAIAYQHLSDRIRAAFPAHGAADGGGEGQ